MHRANRSMCCMRKGEAVRLIEVLHSFWTELVAHAKRRSLCALPDWRVHLYGDCGGPAEEFVIEDYRVDSGSFMGSHLRAEVHEVRFRKTCKLTYDEA